MKQSQSNSYSHGVGVFIIKGSHSEVVSGEAINSEEGNHSALEWFDLSNLPEPLGSTAAQGVDRLKT